MISSGFFLLPGLAAAEAGPAVVLAYLLAGVLVIPAMVSKAELSTAMPRAGGSYYFLDRALGPMIGTIGGLGIWFALVLKSAFALIGIGSYLMLFYDVPMRPVAIGLTLVFGLFNIVGVKETAKLQRVLVYVLLGVLGLFVVSGMVTIFQLDPLQVVDQQFTPFFTHGFEGLATTTGLVFVSYAGLTKIASVAEEVEDPDRTIPLGMTLSLVISTGVYVLGVVVMVAVIEADALRSDLTPVATAAETVFGWIPAPVGLILVVAAAFAAFASTGNAGILSASRYPLAMARDRLVTPRLADLGRFSTPTRAVGLTVLAMILVLLLLDVRNLAKLASAFQLLIFAMINLAVVVMRESHLPSYSPGFRSPLYPWMQIAGILIPLWLITQLGALSVVFTFGVVAAGYAWYHFYAREKVVRQGAIYHLFERLGQHRYDGLEPELRQIIKEKVLGTSNPFDEAVAGALVGEIGPEVRDFEEVVRLASEPLGALTGMPPERLYKDFLSEKNSEFVPPDSGCALYHLRRVDVSEPTLLMFRSRDAVPMPEGPVHAFFFLLSPRDAARSHLQVLARLSSVMDEEHFMEGWLSVDSHDDLKALLLHEDQMLTLTILQTGPTAEKVGRNLRGCGFPRGALVVLIERDGAAFVPQADTTLEIGDRLTFLGEPEVLRTLRGRYPASAAARAAPPVPAAFPG